MSKVKEVLMDIQEELVDHIEAGTTPNYAEIAAKLGVPETWVKDEHEVMQHEMMYGDMEPDYYEPEGDCQQ